MATTFTTNAKSADEVFPAGTKIVAYNIVLKDGAGENELTDLAARVEKDGGHVLEQSGLFGSLVVTFPKDSKSSVLSSTGNYTVERNEAVKAKQWDGAMWGTP